jgi:transcriptional regulator with XRE-family HTH domain
MRQAAHLSRDELAAQTGLDVHSIDRLERGHRPWTLQILQRLSQAPAVSDVPQRVLRSLVQAFATPSRLQDPVVSIAAIVSEARRHAGLTGAQVAEKAGLSEKTLDRIERAQSAPSSQTVSSLLEVAELGLGWRELAEAILFEKPLDPQAMPLGLRGFAAMSPDRRRELASQGGKAAQASGTGHRLTRDEARAAGRRGGATVSRDREHMAQIGRRGGKARATRRAAQSQSHPTTKQKEPQ